MDIPCLYAPVRSDDQNLAQMRTYFSPTTINIYFNVVYIRSVKLFCTKCSLATLHVFDAESCAPYVQYRPVLGGLPTTDQPSLGVL